MIVLDTKVLSELWKPVPEPNVLTWIDAQLVESLYLSAITVAELRFGIAAMPAGKRRTVYQDRLEREVLPAFKGRVLAFDLETSQVYAELMASARAAGRAIGKEDGYIAAIAASCGFAIATRDTSPFEAAGLSVINPWKPYP
ncbi:ribonuclease VapC [Labrys miyagiensis]|uniref:Ribonuclease VapC n=1 Tax=Labrys miyagiensis TaxID=346912 RepID=A0ABQ6CMK7_9HYPH|nr:type II toxin-antitoxin system VapC family toxin [Labrys miyagiensis]GLS20110.1 ribonuclease VapC [Labrys miyagiensis]